jgi:hypothetical protein
VGYPRIQAHNLSTKASQLGYYLDIVFDFLNPYLDNRNDIRSRGFEFGHVNIEMVEGVGFGFVKNYGRAFAHGVDAS